MANPVDPGEIRLIGENSYIRLKPKEGDPFSTISSHWRILYSPSGPGHVFFLESELTGNEVRVYSDNVALARWIQENLNKDAKKPITHIRVMENLRKYNVR